MNKTDALYLSALRAFVQNTAPEAVAAEDWDALLHLADIHTTAGMVCYVYALHPEQAPEAIRSNLRKLYLREFGLYARKAELMRQLAAEYDKIGIDCILLKGIVIRNCYPVPELRTFGDVDFVIRPEDRDKSDQLMKALGYLPETNWEPIFTYRKGQEYYEIHTTDLETDVPAVVTDAGCFRRIWEQTVPSRAIDLPHMLEPEPNLHFLYLLTHLAKHVSNSGAGIRMYLDLAFYLRSFGSSLDRSKLEAELEHLSLSDFANTALHAVQQWFGTESCLPLKPIEQAVMDDFLEFTLSGGIYGYIGRDPSMVYLKQQYRSEEKISKGKTLLYRFFPPAKRIESRYTYLQKHPWLLPAAWIHRLFANAGKWGSFAGHTKKILTADETAVLELRRICKRIGL